MSGQDETVAFLCEPGSYDPAPERVERIDTHAAFVFLAGDRAYKVKREVRYSFMDFSTRDRRVAATLAELALNRRTAPELYCGIRPLVRRQGGLAWGDLLADPRTPEDLPDDTEEAVLVMGRFPQDRLLDRLAERGELDAALVDRLVREVVALHAKAEAFGRPFGGAGGLSRVIEENARDFDAHAEVFGEDRIAAYLERCRAALEGRAGLLDARRAAGFVRRCHGDLHLRNIVLLDGRPTLFDCIEFDDGIATIDLGYDLAFLLMDLERRGYRALANAALNRYLDGAARARLGGLDWLAALPLFLSLRAAVRAKVTAPAIAAQSEPGKGAALRREALGYLAAAEAYLDPPAPVLLAVAGLSGTGKTTQAQRLAPELGASPGAVVLRTDQVRKRLVGVPETERLPPDAYRPDTSVAVYGEMARLAADALAAGHAVAVDAVCAEPSERRLFRTVAERADVPFRGVWLHAPAEILKARVGARAGDASDADAAVVERQLDYDLGEIDWPRVETQDGPDAALSRIRAALKI
jgi:hypothetical protein